MTALLFWLRYLGRIVANIALPFWVGARDRLCHYDTQRPWTPSQPLADFVETAVQQQGLQNESGEIRDFLDYWLPLQALGALKKVLIEFSFTTNAPGFGMMLYGNRRTMGGAFADYCRKIGIYSRTAELCCAITNTFPASSLCMVRAEFKPGGPTRYSIAGSWYFDVLRGHSGFTGSMNRLAERKQADRLAVGVEAISAALEQDFYPLFFGLSFLGDGRLEAKMYWVRFDRKESPLRLDSSLWRFLEKMVPPAAEMERLKRCNDLLWAESCDKMTQIAVEFTEGQTTPKRVNLIYGGTKVSAVRNVLQELGCGDKGAASVERFEKTMQTDRAKFVALRVGGTGISSRLKLYGHAFFDTRQGPNPRETP